MCKLAVALHTNPRLREAGSWSSAYTALKNQEERIAASNLEEILSYAGSSLEGDDLYDDGEETTIGPSDTELPTNGSAGNGMLLPGLHEEPGSGQTPGTVLPPPSPRQLTGLAFAYQADFREWVASYTGRRFNLIHVDFPYGLRMDSANLQNSSVRWDATDGRYADSPELFESLLRTFVKHRDRFIAESAHIIFWVAHKHLSWVSGMFNAAGWAVCETPLIWHKSDNSGIAPDVRRWPRRTYEVAIFASRGDRKILRVKAASVALPSTKEHHLSEKPLSVVSHFLEMLVDDTTEIFDPSCGSGTALEAAIRLGARSAFGLDVLPQHVAHAHARCARAAADRGRAATAAINSAVGSAADSFDSFLQNLGGDA